MQTINDALRDTIDRTARKGARAQRILLEGDYWTDKTLAVKEMRKARELFRLLDAQGDEWTSGLIAYACDWYGFDY